MPMASSGSPSARSTSRLTSLQDSRAHCIAGAEPESRRSRRNDAAFLERNQTRQTLLRIIFVTSEVAPFSKTGGLGTFSS